MVVIMMMYFIIERALVQITPPTVKQTPKDPKGGCQFLPGWNCQILQFPSKSINLPTPWAKLLVIQKQANPWLMQEAEQSHSAWEQTWLCSADRKRNVWWSLGLAHVLRGTHTCVKGMGFYCSEMLFHSPISADSEEVLREACGGKGACGFCVEEKLNMEFLKETERRREN